MGGKPTVVDLFSGAGGMSTGFEMAGYEVVMGVEYIQHFSDTFSINHPKSITICNDIREVSSDEILEKLEGKEIDVVIGGPPCQGFSGAGRRDVKDPRNSLFMDFVRVVGAIKPKYFVMENVPGILNMKNEEGQKVIEIIRQEFNNIGYYVEWKKLLAADYGVPQKRRRVIFIGSPLDSDGKLPSRSVKYPRQTHAEKIPDNNALDVGLPSLQQWVGAGTVLLSKENAPEKSFHSQKMIDGFRRRKERNKASGKGFGWQIIKPEKPCYTISARYWKDGSDALVQYSDNEVRMLTQGEAAAIQTFPKDYEFCGNKKEVWMQIGNAVPCLLAKAIAESLLTHLWDTLITTTKRNSVVSQFELNYGHEVVFEDVPLAWTTRFEFFTPDLEQFPLMYVHRKIEPIEIEKLELPIERVYGFPLNATIVEDKGDGFCNIVVKFLCNAPQGITLIDEVVFEELNHRLGLANKVGYDDLNEICTNSQENLPLLQTIWKDKIAHVYGGFIPHGRIFDEVYGIIRFSASGNAPRLGKTSELRMLYWYMKDIGQLVTFGPDLEHFDFCEFYLLPTIEETRKLDFPLFPVFSEYYDAIKAFWDMEYTETFNLQGYDFRYAGGDTLPLKGAHFETRYEAGLSDYYDRISRLRQIFNRMPGRLYGYIWNMMTFIEVGFKEPFSNREALQSFVKEHHDKKGSSSKVLACILQQCFGLEALPIDTWVKTFIYYPLAINPTNNGKSNNPSNDDIDKLYNSFSNLDKLEKLIWVSSMGNKTNKTEFEDILWCQRYGTDKIGKGPCRGVNPLSCSQCAIRDHCNGFKAISDEMVVVSGDKDIVKTKMINKSHLFGILTNTETPRQVLVLEGRKAVLRDSHTGLAISTDVTIPSSTYKVSDFISEIKP